MTVQGRIYEYLKNGNTLTVRECIDKFGTTELRRVISRLSKAGVKTKSWYEDGYTHTGDPCRYKRYAIMEDNG